MIFLRRIFAARIIEEGFDPVGVGREFAHVAFCCGLQFGLGPYWDSRADGVFEICVEALIWIQFRRITRQIEDFDLVLACLKPRLDQFRVMRPQIVQDKKNLAIRVFDECFKEFDQPVCAKALFNNHPAGFALIGHRRDHRQFLAAARRIGDWSFALWRIRAAAHVGVDDCRLVAPLDFARPEQLGSR